MLPKVFIIILNWNNWADTKECLKSLENNGYPNCEVVVVDNGSTDDSVFQLKSHCGEFTTKQSSSVSTRLPRSANASLAMTVIYNKENLGFSGGNNIGIKYALENNADYVLILNNDTIVNGNFLGKLVKAGESDKKIGLLGPKIWFYNKQHHVILEEGAKRRPIESRGKVVRGRDSIASLQNNKNALSHDNKKIWFAGGKINWLYNKGEMKGYGEIDKGQYDSPEIQETEYITGCCLLAKSKTLKKIGLMPDEYFLYYEDTDWSLRAQKAGFRTVFVPSAQIKHKCSKSAIEGSPSYIYYHSRNGLILARKFAPRFILPFVHLDAFWRIIKQLIKLVFFPKKRAWANHILLGIKDFYLGKQGKYENWH